MNKNAWLMVSSCANVILLSALLIFGLHRVQPNEPKSANESPSHPVAAERRTHPASMEAANQGRTRSGQADPVTASKTGLTEGQAQSLSFTLASGRTIQFPSEFVSLVRRLQREGVSDESLATFIQAELSRQWSVAQQEIQRKIRRGEMDQREQLRFYNDLQNLQRETVKSMLGEEAYARVENQAALRWAESSGLSLAPEQVVKAYQVTREYGQGGRRSQELSAAFQGGEIDQWDYQEQQAAMQKEYEQQMMAMLGAPGFAELKRNADWNYGNLRRQLQDVNLPDTQVDALYSVMQQFGQKQQEIQRLNQSGKLQPQEYSQQWTALNKEQEGEYRRILGTDGYAQYQKAMDSRYQQLKRYAPAWQLSQTDIEHVYQSLAQAAQAVQEYQQQVRSASGQGQTVNWQEIQKATEDYKRQAEDELRQYLGEERYNKLNRAGIIRMDYITTNSRVIYSTGNFMSAPVIMY